MTTELFFDVACPRADDGRVLICSGAGDATCRALPLELERSRESVLFDGTRVTLHDAPWLVR